MGAVLGEEARREGRKAKEAQLTHQPLLGCGILPLPSIHPKVGPDFPWPVASPVPRALVGTKGSLYDSFCQEQWWMELWPALLFLEWTG